MRKIKNFKINLYMKDVLRVVRKLVNAVDVSVDLEKTVQRCICFYFKLLSPSFIYDTFSKGSLPVICEENIPSKWVAESIFFVTIGSKFEEEYKKSGDAFGEHTSKIVSAMAVDALEQSKNFVQRIISNEAQDENCEIAKVVSIKSDYYEEISKIVPAYKIGVSVEESVVCPKYSSAGLFYWIPSKKKTLCRL